MTVSTTYSKKRLDQLRLILPSMITSLSQDLVILRNHNSISKGDMFTEYEQVVVWSTGGSLEALEMNRW